MFGSRCNLRDQLYDFKLGVESVFSLAPFVDFSKVKGDYQLENNIRASTEKRFQLYTAWSLVSTCNHGTAESPETVFSTRKVLKIKKVKGHYIIVKLYGPFSDKSFLFFSSLSFPSNAFHREQFSVLCHANYIAPSHMLAVSEKILYL